MKKNMVVEDEMSIIKFLKIIIAVLIIFVLFTFITKIITNKEKNDETTNIQYDKILVGSILNRPESDYYVLVISKDDENALVYTNLISTYKAKSEHRRFYTADLADEFNKIYVADTNNLNVTAIDDIRFAETTLLHISDGKIVSSRVGDNIKSYLENLSA